MPAKFTVADGRTLTVNINVHQVRKVWDVLKIDMHAAGVAHELMSPEAMFREVPRLLAVLCEADLCRIYPELQDYPAACLTKMDDLLAAEQHIRGAHAAVCAAWADFCRSRGLQGAAKILDAAPRIATKAAQIDARPSPSPVEEWMDATLAGQTSQPFPLWQKERQAPGTSSPASPESSDSPPTTTSPGASST